MTDMTEAQKIYFKAALDAGDFDEAWKTVLSPLTDRNVAPDGYWEIDAYTNGYQIVVVGYPPNDEDLPEGSPTHSCDQMGCGSLDHVVARIPVMAPMVELEWNGIKKQPDPIAG